VSPFINDHLSADHRHDHAHVMESLDRHAAEILGEQDEVGRLADVEAALKAFLTRGKGAVNGVHAEGRGQVHALVGATDISGHRVPRQRLLDPE
jgi:hypothetical protein